MHKNFIVNNFAFRLGEYHPGRDIQIGVGDTDADIIVVQPRQKTPERDAITGALKTFGMLDNAYRATMNVVDLPDPTEGRALYKNRACLLELIEIIRPMIVIACGPDTTALLKGCNAKLSSFSPGRKFQVKDLTDPLFYGILDPVDYGFARAPQALKDQGRAEWTKIATLYDSLKKKREDERWAS